MDSTDKSAYTVTTQNAWITLASTTLDNAMNLDQISMGIFEKSLENMSYLRAQNGASQSRLSFNIESLAQQRTNLQSALGRIVDTDLAVESSNLQKYSLLKPGLSHCFGKGKYEYGDRPATSSLMMNFDNYYLL